MFFRVLLLSYFALGAAWGPAFCCCRVRSLVESCARLPLAFAPVAAVKSTSAPAQSQASAGGCPRCRAAAEQRQRELAGDGACCTVFPQQHEPDSDCPCQQPSEAEFGLVGVVLPGFVNAVSGDQCPVDSFSGALKPQLDIVPAFLTRLRGWDKHFESGVLSGRALLRAYQTLNC